MKRKICIIVCIVALTPVLDTTARRGGGSRRGGLSRGVGRRGGISRVGRRGHTYPRDVRAAITAPRPMGMTRGTGRIRTVGTIRRGARPGMMARRAGTLRRGVRPGRIARPVRRMRTGARRADIRPLRSARTRRPSRLRRGGRRPVRPGRVSRPGALVRRGAAHGLRLHKPHRRGVHRTPAKIRHQRRFLRRRFRHHDWDWWFYNDFPIFISVFPFTYYTQYGEYPPIYYDYYDIYGVYPLRHPSYETYLADSSVIGQVGVTVGCYTQCSKDCGEECNKESGLSDDECNRQCAASCRDTCQGDLEVVAENNEEGPQ